MKKNSLRAWVEAVRLRTLPLALASIGMGSFLAAFSQEFDLLVLILCAITTIFLQILSNLANDYGDFKHGADSLTRKGPSRAVQSGAISATAMKKGLIVFAILSFVSGVLLLYISLGFNARIFLFFLALGILAIFAAIAYTNGKRPYGYAGLGDISVLIFFGLVGVAGTFYLHTLQLRPDLILPALSCGLLATAVLNLNNIRDIHSDREAGKKTIPVRIGRENAVIYHWILLGLSIISAAVFVWMNYHHYLQFLFLISLPFLIKNARAVKHKQEAAQLDPYLKQMALSTLIFVLSFGIGLLLAL